MQRFRPILCANNLWRLAGIMSQLCPREKQKSEKKTKKQIKTEVKVMMVMRSWRWLPPASSKQSRASTGGSNTSTQAQITSYTTVLKHDAAQVAVCNWLFECGIPFNVTRHPAWHEICGMQSERQGLVSSLLATTPCARQL